jgi:hypothetical protein
MALDALVVLPASELDDDDLVVAALRDDLAFDLTALDERGAHLDVRAFADEQHLLESDGVADGGVEALHAKALALTGAVLLTAGSENGIHDGVLLGDSGRCPVERLAILETWAGWVNEALGRTTGLTPIRYGGWG